MGDRLLAVAEMATKAFLGPRLRPLRRVHSGGDIGGVVGAGHVRAEPSRGAAVTHFAADTVGDVELRPAALRRDIIGMAVEAHRGLLRIAETEVLGDAQRPRLLERGIGLRVLVLGLPHQIFVLLHPHIGEMPDPAVAIVAGAVLHADMGPVRARRGERRWRRGRGWRGCCQRSGRLRQRRRGRKEAAGRRGDENPSQRQSDHCRIVPDGSAGLGCGASGASACAALRVSSTTSPRCCAGAPAAGRRAAPTAFSAQVICWLLEN